MRLLLAVICAGALTSVVGFQLWNLSLIFRMTLGIWAPGMVLLGTGLLIRVFRFED